MHLTTYPDSSNSHTCRAHTTPGEGVLTLKRVMGLCGGKDPLFTLNQLLHKTPFSAFFQYHKTSSLTKITILPIFQFNIPNFDKFSVPNPKNGQNQVKKPKSLCQKSILKAALCQKTISSTSLQIWRRSILQAPIFQPFGPLTPTITKVDYPLGI